jgi:hypothetical protein
MAETQGPMVRPPRKKSPRVLVLFMPQTPIPTIKARKITKKIIPIIEAAPFGQIVYTRLKIAC